MRDHESLESIAIATRRSAISSTRWRTRVSGSVTNLAGESLEALASRDA